jgi:hypothetical protein
VSLLALNYAMELGKDRGMAVDVTEALEVA